MAFQPLKYSYTFTINGFPEEWLPLLFPYDPDIPFFPLLYFHVLIEPEQYDPNNRAYGFIHRVNHTGVNLEATIMTNKDLNNDDRARNMVETEIQERLGVTNPVTRDDVANTFRGVFQSRNRILTELWDKIVTRYLGNQLPFGRMYDKVYGFIRFLSSWNSPSGRKSELMQTHYFMQKFGVQIPIAPELPQIFFKLLPSAEEFFSNDFTLYPALNDLSIACDDFVGRYSFLDRVSPTIKLLHFKNPLGGHVDTSNILHYIDECNPASKEPLIEAFNAFDKGPPRTVRFIQMFSDLKMGRLNPAPLTANDMATIYRNAKGFHQTTKVIALYSQQCFGNVAAFPIDLWMRTVMKWPLERKHVGLRNDYAILSYSNNLGKVERLLWILTQARKVHSHICDDAVWCIKKSSNKKARGANPLACGACDTRIRSVCPAYARITNGRIIFNSQGNPKRHYIITTSSGNNQQQNQSFSECEGPTLYGIIQDDFTAVDYPQAFRPFPQPGHTGTPITVSDFIRMYC